MGWMERWEWMEERGRGLMRSEEDRRFSCSQHARWHVRVQADGGERSDSDLSVRPDRVFGEREVLFLGMLFLFVLQLRSHKHLIHGLPASPDFSLRSPMSSH